MAVITCGMVTLSSCGKDDDKDEDKHSGINALVIDLNASCNGKPCI